MAHFRQRSVLLVLALVCAVSVLGCKSQPGGKPVPAQSGQPAGPPEGERVHKIEWNFVGAKEWDILLNGVPVLSPPWTQNPARLPSSDMFVEGFLRPGANALRVQAVVPAGALGGKVAVNFYSLAPDEKPESKKMLVTFDEPAPKEGLKYDKTFSFEASGVPQSIWHDAESFEKLSDADRKAVVAYLESMREALARKDGAQFLALRVNQQDLQQRAKASGMTYEALIKNGAADMQQKLMSLPGYEVRMIKPEDLVITACGQLTVVTGKPYILWAGAPQTKTTATTRTLELSMFYFCKVGPVWVVFM